MAYEKKTQRSTWKDRKSLQAIPEKFAFWNPKILLLHKCFNTSILYCAIDPKKFMQEMKSYVYHVTDCLNNPKLNFHLSLLNSKLSTFSFSALNFSSSDSLWLG